MFSQQDIFEFIDEQTGIDYLRPTDDLLLNGIHGDDFHELMEVYAAKFKVDMTRYLWYFHGDEEGNSIGGSFFRAPYDRVAHIPITPALLLEMANKGHWDIQYPEHKLPKRRWDLIVNTALVVFALVLVIYFSLT
jgi:hypothetical protein